MALENIGSGAPRATAPPAASTAGVNGSASIPSVIGSGAVAATAASGVTINASAPSSVTQSGTAATTSQDFTSVLAGMGAQNVPPPTSPLNPGPPAGTPTVPVAVSPPATPVLPTSGAPSSGSPDASAPSPSTAPTTGQLSTAPATVPPLPAPAPVVSLPTLVATFAPTTAQTPSSGTSAVQTDDATSATPKSTSDDSDDSAIDAATSAEAAALSGAFLMQSLFGQTMQTPATLSTPTAITTNISALTNDSEQSETAPAQPDVNETFSLCVTDEARSLTQTATETLVGGTWAAGGQADGSTPTGSDNTPGASGVLGAAQATPLHAAALHSQATADAAPPPELRAPVGSAAWTDQLGAQLTWMTRHGQESGSLHVSPEHLGPVEVRIEMRDGSASVWFGAAHPDTRSAIEQSLPRLRELFASSGLSLADAGVARDAPRQNAKPVTSISSANGTGNTSLTISKVAAALSRSGLVDTYV
jgi:flagellar hook-length control protein FliK